MKKVVGIILMLSFLILQQTAAQNIKELEARFDALFEKGDYEKALPLIEQLVVLAAKEKKDTNYAYYLNTSGELNYYMGAYEVAIKQFEACKDLRKKLLGDQNEDYASSLNNLGLSLATIGKYELAEPLYQEALDIWRKIYGKEDYKIAAGLNNLALLYENMGDYKKAEPFYKEAIQIMEKTRGKEHSEYANTISNLASVYESMGLYDKAEPLYKEVLEIKRKVHGIQHPQYAKSLNNLAMLYYHTNEYDEAEPLYKEALSVLEESLGKEHIAYAITLNSLAALYQQIDRYNESLALYEETMNIRKKVFGVNHPKYATTLNNVAQLYDLLGLRDKAQNMYQEAMLIIENNFGKEHPRYASSLRNLGRVLYKNKDYEAAKTCFLSAKKTIVNVFSDEHPDAIYATVFLGNIAMGQNHLDEARTYLDEAILKNTGLPNLGKNIDEVWKNKLLSKGPITYLYLLENLRVLYQLQRKHYDHSHHAKELFEAKMVTKTALELAERYRRQFVSESDKLIVLEKSVEWVYKAIQNSIEIAEQQKLEEFHDKAFQYAEQSKSVLLADAVNGDKAHVFGDLPDSLFDYEKSLQEEQAAIRGALLEQHDEKDKKQLRAKLNALNLEIGQFQERIARDYPKYNALKYSQNHISTSHIQELLDDETALIEYVVADTVIYIFSVDKKHFDLYHISCTKDSLSTQIKRLRRVLSDYNYIYKHPKTAARDYVETAHWFYKTLVEPAIHHDEIKHLLIIPDGELGHLPFEAFLTKPANVQAVDYKSLSYLLHDYKVSYDFSASLWDENETDYLKSEAGTHHELVLACAANYKQATDSAIGGKFYRPTHLQKIRTKLGELPAAQQEVEGLNEAFEGTFLYGNDVNERFFKEHASEYGVIHLAMHGLLNINHPILSSLVFTENADSLEDNFLCAYEIAHLHLNAQLVVLSACETGYGKFEQGEGVISLARAFMYAGVPSLVVSMWAVNDLSTAQIMMYFYENLSLGMDKSAALQQAKIKYLEVAAGPALHPAYWAAFIQLGDHHPVHIKRKNKGAFVWLLGLGALFLIGGLGLFLRKKK